MDHCFGLHGHCTWIWVSFQLIMFLTQFYFFRFIFMMLTRYCAKLIVWLFIFSFIICLIGLGAIYIMKAENVTLNLYFFVIKRKGMLKFYLNRGSTWASVTSVITQVQSATSNSDVSLAVGIICLVLGGILLVLVCCFFSRIKLAAAIIAVDQISFICLNL